MRRDAEPLGSGAISSDIQEANVADILIRNLPAEVMAAIDAQAARSGLSRAAYLRAMLEREHARSDEAVTVEGLARLAELAADLDDPEVMSGAWS